MTTNTFPILNLPLLAIQNVLRILDTSKLIDFAFLSKVCRVIVRSLKPKKNSYKLTACFRFSYYVLLIPPCPGYGVHILGDEMEKRRDYFGVEIAPTSESVINFVQVWTDFLSNLFNCSISSLRMHDYVCAGYYEQIATWLNNRQPSLPCFSFETFPCHILSHEVFEFILNNFKATDKLEIHHTPTENFRYTGQLDAKKMSLNYSTWITAQHLMNSRKAIAIELVYSTLQPTDVNLFLKSWVAGELPNLRNFRTDIRNCDENTLMDGLKVTKLESEALRELQSRVSAWEVLSGGYEIQNMNGFRARLATRTGFDFSMFYFFVIEF